MKLQICLSALLVVSVSCSHDDTTQPQLIPAKAFAIHLQSWFSNTPVIVFVDESQVFADTVSTGYAVAVAAIIPVQINQGPHLLTVTIPNRVSKDTLFSIYDTLYAAVYYDSAKATIDYHFQRNQFGYR